MSTEVCSPRRRVTLLDKHRGQLDGRQLDGRGRVRVVAYARVAVREYLPRTFTPEGAPPLYQPNISVIYQRPTDNALSALYQG